MKIALVAAVLASAPLLSQAAVNLEVGRGMELLAVNGVPVDSPLFIGKVDSQVLADGQSQIAVRIGQLVKDRNVTKKFTSEVSVITFTANNQTIRVAAPVLGMWEAGETFNRTPDWLLTSGNEPVSFRLGELKSLTNMSALRNFGQELDAFNRSNQPAALPHLAGVLQGQAKNIYDQPAARAPAVAAVPAKPVAGDMAQQPMILSEVLPASTEVRNWYQQLTPAEKRDFISWAAQNL
ncbi:MAG: DUF2057 family protein [Aeromonas sp.]